MNWIVSKKKTDFIGRRALARPYLTGPNRKQLVGLLTEDPSVVLPDGAHAVEGDPDARPASMIGHVTSTYFSPTMGRSIAMALIRGGQSRMGETLTFPVAEGEPIRAKIVDPVFYDREGERQNV